MAAKRSDVTYVDDRARLRGWIDLAVGLTLAALGAILRYVAHDAFVHANARHLLPTGLVVVGALTALRGGWRLLRAPRQALIPLAPEVGGFGYKSFVAWRYLLDAKSRVSFVAGWLLIIGLIVLGLAGLLVVELDPPLARAALYVVASAVAYLFLVVLLGVLRYSKVALVALLIGVALIGLSTLCTKLVVLRSLPIRLAPEVITQVLQIANAALIAGGVLAGLAMFFGVLRAYFTFFTTVPIGGVWIGTTALVVVLAVMSGFETDLRDKILGSNAHIQITREDGEFTEWREVKAKLDGTPGVVGSTPYAISEVVVAANNQGMNVIIKGIDPKTIGDVTDLVSNLKDREAMKRLEPLTGGTRDLRVRPRAGAPSGPVIDPPPPDMPERGEPIDFSVSEGGGAGSGSGSAPAADPETPPASGSATDKLGLHRAGGYGGDARRLLDLDLPEIHPARPAGDAAARLDPPPADLAVVDEPPADYSSPDYEPDSVVKVVDIPPFDAPSLSSRTQSLPGMLVGQELVKQTHMYTGEEVRVVSPLSDPSNPDATGTPIPYNRDYRVAGVFYTGMYEYDLKFVYVTLESLQDFLDRGDAVDGIEVRVNSPDDADVFVRQLEAELGPHYRVQDWRELNRSLFSALKLEKIAMFLVLGIVILVASFSIIGNLIMVVVEKAREIALLKTLGASDVGVMQLFAIQGLMIGLIGTALGIATGLGLCWVFRRFGLPLNPDVYYIDRLPIHVDPASVAAAASAGILISIAATLYPAIVAARVRPAAGMRH